MLLCIVFIAFINLNESKFLKSTREPFLHKAAKTDKDLEVEYQHITSIPDEFDWRTKAFLSPLRNQHLPKYCGSCWANAASSTLSDRYMIKYKNQSINLSVQELVDCSHALGCYGGSSLAAFNWIIQNGIVDESCKPYIAKKSKCDKENRCTTCPNFNDPCYTVKDYKKWIIKEFGIVKIANMMKKEIMTNGPISCSMYASDNFLKNYKGGIYMEKANERNDHEISIVGWGLTVDEENKPLPYWIVRNSWGQFWGEDGFFRVPTHEYSNADYSLGIGSEICDFPILF